MTNANPVVTSVLARDDGNEDEDEASTEEYRTLRPVVGKSEFIAPRMPDIAFATNRLARSLASKRLLFYLCGTLNLCLKLQIHKKCVHDPDRIHRQRLSIQQTHTKIRFLTADHA